MSVGGKHGHNNQLEKVPADYVDAYMKKEQGDPLKVPGRGKGKSSHGSTSRFSNTPHVELQPLPLLKDTPQAEQPGICHTETFFFC